MNVRVGTFNLNNLFSRFNFRAEIETMPSEGSGGLTLTFGEDEVSVRSFSGRLVREKKEKDTEEIARRILEMNADVLAVQEVEHVEILRQFNEAYLGHLYPYIALIEGNDKRLIDVGVLSKLPIGCITSHQTAIHPDAPDRPVFGRDLLQVEILNRTRKRKLFNIYNTHLKSHFVPFWMDQEKGAEEANERRRQQAEMISQIIGKAERPNGRFVLTGDMNDPIDSEFLAPMRTIDGRELVNALENPEETRPAKPDRPDIGPGPQTKAWTHRFNPAGPEPPHYQLYDHIWVSQGLANKFSNPMIDRRTKHGGDGSDHDPAWIDLDL